MDALLQNGQGYTASPNSLCRLRVQDHATIERAQGKARQVFQSNSVLTPAQHLPQNTKQPFCLLLGKDEACLHFLGS